MQKRCHIVVPYTKGLCESYKSICSKYGVQAYFKRGNTLKNLLMFPKDKDEMKKQSNIIYWYRCGRTECNDEYIGESARTFEERFKEHLKHHHQSMNMTIQLATKHQWRTLRLLKERVMASLEPSRRPSTLE